MQAGIANHDGGAASVRGGEANASEAGRQGEEMQLEWNSHAVLSLTLASWLPLPCSDSLIHTFSASLLEIALIR